VSYPLYPLDLRTAPDGNVYIKMEDGGWQWAGRRTEGRDTAPWKAVNDHYELLLIKRIMDDGRVDALEQVLRTGYLPRPEDA
jgi:hypothetical protein